MRTCKVYCTYFGNRRGRKSASPANAEEALTVFKRNIENDMMLDSGVANMDIIVVNNYSDQISREGQEYLQRINGTRTPYGEIFVHERENKGGSLGAYSFAYELHENKYDYWLFIEDDIKMIYPRYYEMFTREFELDDNIGFLALTIIHKAGSDDEWVSGGFGVTRSEMLKKVKEKYGKLPFDEGINLSNYGRIGLSEFFFSNAFRKVGYDIRNPKQEDVLPLADNWEDFPPQVEWQKIKKFNFTNKSFLYHLGM